jgi:hypothetical protein
MYDLEQTVALSRQELEEFVNTKRDIREISPSYNVRMGGTEKLFMGFSDARTEKMADLGRLTPGEIPIWEPIDGSVSCRSGSWQLCLDGVWGHLPPFSRVVFFESSQVFGGFPSGNVHILDLNKLEVGDPIVLCSPGVIFILQRVEQDQWLLGRRSLCTG